MTATFHELWEIALVLEPLAAELAAGHACDSDLDELADNIATTQRLLIEGQDGTMNYAQLVKLDITFHNLVARASGNRALVQTREPISLLYNPVMSQLQMRLPQANTRNLVAHQRIFEGLRRQDSGHAETWMRKHLIDYQRGYVLARLDMDVPIALNDPWAQQAA